MIKCQILLQQEIYMLITKNSIFKVILWFYMYEYFPCLCAHRPMHDVFPWFHGVQERVLDPLELGLQIVLSYHVTAGNEIWKNSQCS